MNWNEVLRLPTTLLIILAGLLLLPALAQLLAARQHVRYRHHLAAAAHVLLLAICLLIAALLGAMAISLSGYRFLSEEQPVVYIDARILSPQRWALTLAWPDGATRKLMLAGDAFQVDAIVLQWKLPALPPLYRLDRIAGRYEDFNEETSASGTVIGFSQAGTGDLVALKQPLPRWLPEVDTRYGSGAFLPLVDGGHYNVSLMRTGALVARPDPTTAQRIGQPLGG